MSKKTAEKPPKQELTPPTPKKIISMLESEGVTRKKVCEVLKDGLDAEKHIVADGEIIDTVPDHHARHKFVETILEAIGEKKLIIPPGELHFHFTSVLQMVAAYEQGDPKAIKEAERLFNGATDAEIVPHAESPGSAEPAEEVPAEESQEVTQ